MYSCRLMLEGLLSLLCYCESGSNQYAGQKTLTNDFGESVLLLEVGMLYKHCGTIPFKNTSCCYEKIISS